MGQNCIERMETNHTKYKIAMFRVKQQQPYEFKKAYAEIRAWEFYKKIIGAGHNVHVSVGGVGQHHAFTVSSVNRNRYAGSLGFHAGG